MAKDEIFRDKISKIPDFKFGSSVARVFDDMVNRSVPFYGEIQRMIGELAADFVQPGTEVYDLGCSTGNTLLGMNSTIDPAIRFIGVDDSPQMLEKCRAKLDEAGFTRPLELRLENLNLGVTVSNASAVVLCLTLQFVRPIHRPKILRQIFEGLNPGGVLILVEKILTEEEELNHDFIKYYYNFKRRNHYSEMEIAQKREALENVLIPLKISENIGLLRDAGFDSCEVFFKWYNFSGILALKR